MNDINAEIWNNLYSTGNYLHYPAEVFVALYMRIIGKDRQSGRFLDHGCGSGNNSEFLARRGWSVIGTDVSSKAVEVRSSRLSALEGEHESVLIDGSAPLGPQLGSYDHAVVWDSLCYNRIAKAKADALDIVGSLPVGGLVFINMPTPRHVFATEGRLLEDGSYENGRPETRQAGAIMAVPRDLDDLISWFPGCEVVEKGHFSFDFSGFREFSVLVARKAGA